MVIGEGLNIKRINGKIWSDKRRCSQEDIGGIFDRKVGKDLFFVFLRIRRE